MKLFTFSKEVNMIRNNHDFQSDNGKNRPANPEKKTK